MSQLAGTASTEIAKLRANDGLDRVYVFIVEALYEAVSEVEFGAHVGPAHLAAAVRDLAMERYGPLARTVLSHWGIRSTADLGRVIFAMIDLGILHQGESDRVEDFSHLFDFEQVFDFGYPWTVPVDDEASGAAPQA